MLKISLLLVEFTKMQLCNVVTRIFSNIAKTTAADEIITFSTEEPINSTINGP